MMKIVITYFKATNNYRYCNGYMEYPIDREQAMSLIARWALDCDQTIIFGDSVLVKTWSPVEG